MPDPKPGGGVMLNGNGLSPEQMEAAQQACDHWMEDAIPEDAERELSEEEKQSMLDMAECMREKGYDFPDPVFDGGRVTQRFGAGEDAKPGGPPPDDQAFQADAEECAKESGVEPPRFSHDEADS
jgi:hypothetical protein